MIITDLVFCTSTVLAKTSSKISVAENAIKSALNLVIVKRKIEVVSAPQRHFFKTISNQWEVLAVLHKTNLRLFANLHFSHLLKQAQTRTTS